MNPNGLEGGPQPNFELPGQQPESQPQPGEVQSGRALEKSNPSESGAGKQQPPPLNPASDQALPASQTQVGDDDSATPPPPHQISADNAKDAELIEKIWITKAKEIIAKTRDDPFMQKQEISREKADYIQKRYNKTIPVDDK